MKDSYKLGACSKKEALPTAKVEPYTIFVLVHVERHPSTSHFVQWFHVVHIVLVPTTLVYVSLF